VRYVDKMQREPVIYGIYTTVFLLLTASILAVPLLAENGDMSGAYQAFRATCHQKLSRSLCIFNDGQSRWIGDCTPQGGEPAGGIADYETTKVVIGDAVGYKMPVCSRDIGLYAAILLGALVYPLVREIGDRKLFPPILLVVAILPLALDGGLQLATTILFAKGFIGFTYESTNAIRLLTGIISGLAASFYAIPILMNMFGEKKPRSR
jgi:uncharacterized membrane protein